MLDVLIFFVLIIIGIGGFLLFQQFQKITPHSEEEQQKWRDENALQKAEISQLREKVGALQQELDTERSEKNEYQGKNKQMFVEKESLKSKIENLQHDLNEAKKSLSHFEAEKLHREQEFQRATEQLENARKKLEAEQERVKREDEEKITHEKEEQNRIWNDHENMVIARLKDVCQSQHIGFSYAENTKLPEGFDGSLKPDFLVEFLGKYIIFDAKKSKDIGNYINDQVKKTAAKIKKSSSQTDIYPSVFFVIPSEELQILKKTYFYEEGISFFVLGAESVEAVLAAYKRITEYERISEFDPQDREKIIDVIANYDRHMSFRNTVDIILSKQAVEVMNSKQSINEQILEEVEVKKKSMRDVKLNASELKRLSQSLELQEQEMNAMIAPKAAVHKAELEEVQKTLL